MLVNNGEARDWFGYSAEGPVIAIKKSESYGDLEKAEFVLRPEDCSPELKNYIDSIGETTRKLKDANLEEIQRILKGFTAEEVEREIRRLA